MPDRITVDGIDVPFDKDKLEDARFLLLLGDLDDDELGDGEKLAAMSRLTRYLFGGERSRIVGELAGKSGGALPAQEFTAFLLRYLAEVGAKNS